MSGFLKRLLHGYTQQFDTPERLFQGLCLEQSEAIRFLYAKVALFITGLGRRYDLPEEDIEELIGDCITTTILKMRNGQYVFQGYDPASFTMEIAKNKVKKYRDRRQRPVPLPVEDPAPDWTDRTDREELERWLGQLPDHCRQLIQLKYLEEMPDKEIIAQQLTQYTTVDALKNHRSKCMKKLSAIANALS